MQKYVILASSWHVWEGEGEEEEEEEEAGSGEGEGVSGYPFTFSQIYVEIHYRK